MSEYYLVVSDPPHGEVDPKSAAAPLGLTATEVRMKANHAASEIWLVEDDPDEAKQKAKALLDAGLKVARLKGTVLAGVPTPESIAALGRSPTGFMATGDWGSLEIAQDRPVMAVVCDPATDAKEPRSSRERATTPSSAFVDLYAVTGSRWEAVRVVSEEVDFSGLGDLAEETPTATLHAMLNELRTNFAKVLVDERLVGVTYRFVMVGGKGIPQVLAGISEELEGIGPYDLASRLAFLTSIGRRKREAPQT